jgi:lysophospholipase L1-like esterase
MAHMPASGVSGVDLYSYTDEGVWRFVKVGIPRRQYSNEFEVAVSPKRLYRLYLPLYSGIKTVHFGIKEGAKIESADLPNRNALKPAVFYGGSSTQGACVSRPGNAWPNIVGRLLDAPTICMGFNGQGKMLFCEAVILARIDASAYCFLCLGNMAEADYREQAERFLRRLKELKPSPPIVFGSFHYPLVKNPGRHAFAAWLKDKLRREDPVKWADFDIVPLWEMCSKDCDGTVDGGHPNDYGSFRMAEAFAAALRRAEEKGN